MDFLVSLTNQMQKTGIFINGIINKNDYRYQRFENLNSRNHAPDIFVKIKIGQRGAIYGDWHDNNDQWVDWDYKKNKFVTPSEKRKYEIEFEQFKKQIIKEKEISAINCQLLFNSAHEVTTTHSYVVKKKITPFAARQKWLDIILPVYNVTTGNIQSVQLIHSQGKKLFAKLAPVKSGCLPLQSNFTKTIRICEGWATGCSIQRYTNDTVLVAFSKNNIENIIIGLKKRYKGVNIVLCSDNDASKKRNYGLENSFYLSKKYGLYFCYPIFPPELITHSDFNDLDNISNGDEMIKQLNSFRKK